MADINVLLGKRDALPTAGTLTVLGAGVASTIPWNGVDERMCLLITTTAAAASLVISKGTGIRASIGVLTLALEASKTYAIVLDSMRFKDMATGKVTINCTTASSAALIQLP
jgi:hypothetical protein